MKNKRFWAALLCTAMVLTSQSYSVPVFANEAVMADELKTAEASGMEDSVSVETPELIDEENALCDQEDKLQEEYELSDITISETPELLDEELLFENEADQENDIVETETTQIESNETVAPTEYLTTISKNGLNYLALKPDYESLEKTGVEVVVIPKETNVIPKDSKLFEGNHKVITVSFEDEAGTLSDNLIIEDGAFMGSSIKNFYAPANYKTINANTFRNCVNLRSFKNKSVTSVGDYAFENCGAFGDSEDVNWDKKVTRIGDYAFSRSGYDILTLSDMVDPTAPIIIGKGAFSYCTRLLNTSIPSNVELIPESCFEGCTALITINANNSANGTVVGSNAFKGCTALTNIGEKSFNVKVLSSNAFNGCTKLDKVRLSETVRSVSSNAFAGCSAITLVEFYYHNDQYEADGSLYIDPYAFPADRSKITLGGFGGVVLEYYERSTSRFKKWNDLRTAHKVIGYGEAGKSGFLQGKIIDPATQNKRPNEDVTITIKPREISGGPWRLRRGSLYDRNNGLTFNDFEFVSGDENSQQFKFKMTFDDVIIDVTPGFYTDAMLDGAEYSAKIAAYDDKGSFQETSSYWYAPRTGYMGQILVDADVNKSGGKYNGKYKLGQWMFRYDSSDTKIATVNEKGVITAHKPGSAKITATYKTTNKKVEIPIVVGPEVDITELKIEPVGINPDRTNRTIDGILYKDIPVITLDESKLRSDSKTIDLKLKAMAPDETGTQTYAVNADWIIGNETIASLKSAKSTDNNNAVTIKKNTSGDTYVRASFNTYRKDDDDKNIILYAYLLIKVINITPRVTMDDIVIDTNCDDRGTIRADKKATGGVPITLIAAGNEQISPTAVLDLWVGKDIANARQYDGLLIINPNNSYDGKYRLVYNPVGEDNAIGTESGINKKKVYTGSNKLWIRGKYDNAGVDDYFWIPLNKVTIENRPLNLSAKASGRINLWYKNSCYAPILETAVDEKDTIIKYCYEEVPRKDSEKYDRDGNRSYIDRYVEATVGKVLYTNNISYETATVRNVMLWDTDHYKNWKKHKPDYTDDGNLPAGEKDKLNTNFEAYLKNREGTNEIDFGVIRRNTADLEYDLVNDKKIDVVKGYLAVYFDGYTKPVLQPVVIPTIAKAPAYVLSETSITENSKITKGEFRFKILDSSKKNTMIRQDNVAEYSLDKTDGSVFTGIDIKDEDVIITAADMRLSGKKTAVINVRKANWQKSAQYKYTVNYVEKDPTAKLKASTVKLNRWYPDMPVSTELALNQANCVLTLVNSGTGEFVYSGSPNLAGDAANIRIKASTITGYNNKLTVTVDFPNKNSLPAKGTYKYTFTPQFNYGGAAGTAVNLKPMTFNVKVLDNQPTVRFSSKSHVFNMDYPDLENKEVTATFGNLPDGVALKDINIDVSNAKWTLVKSAKDSSIAPTVGSNIKMYPSYDADKKKWKMTFMLKDTGLKNRDFSIQYELSNIKINDSVIKPVKINISGINREPTVAVSAKGKLNAIDYVTPMQYTVKFANLTNPTLLADSVQVIGLSDNKVSQFLEVKPDANNNKLLNVTLISGKSLPNKDYKFQLRFMIDKGNNKLDVYSKALKVKPVQRTPKIIVNIEWNPRVKKASFFSGVADNNRTIDVAIIKTSELKTYISKVKIKDSNASDLKNAFEVEYHPSMDFNNAIAYYKTFTKNTKRDYPGYITIKCTNPELLKAGKTYNLALETEFEGQFYKTDSKGNYVKDAKGNYIKINGSTFKVPVVVYK